jgi:hypothetical protein
MMMVLLINSSYVIYTALSIPKLIKASNMSSKSKAFIHTCVLTYVHIYIANKQIMHTKFISLRGLNTPPVP